MHRFPLLLLLLLMLTACDRISAPSTPGSLQITASTTGTDMVAYLLRVDDRPERVLSPNETVTIAELSPGTHAVLLSDIASNCAVQGQNPVVATVTEGGVTPVAFQVACVATTGQLEITMATIGLDGPSSYTLHIDNGTLPILPNGSNSVPGISGGAHVVTLGGLTPNCSVAGGDRRDVSVTVGGLVRDTVRLNFGVTCTAMTGVIEIAFTASGVDFGDTFQVGVGSAPPRALAVNATTRIEGVAGGDQVVSLVGLPTNCSAVGEGSRVLRVTTGGLTRDTVRTSFEATCAAADKIAFTRGAAIWVAHADGSSAFVLTDGYNPSWSPDGAKIVFSRFDCDYYDCYTVGLFTLEATGPTRRIVALTTQVDDNPAWSPDGSSIAFVRQGGARTDLYFIKADGTSATRVPLPTGVSVASRPAWSPDGTRLVYGCRIANEGFDDICQINKDGSGFARLTSDGRYNGQPAWSPDGARIAFSRTDFQVQRDVAPQMYVALMNADGTGVKRVATGSDPAWSRDGGTIVFRNGTQPGLATVKPDGTGLTRITLDPSDGAPAWR